MADRFLLHAELHDGESTGFLPDHGTTKAPSTATSNTCAGSRRGWDPGDRQPQRRHAVRLDRPRQGAAEAGADALELNVYHVAADPLESGDAVEARYVALLTELRR
jgi:dihydroorotate dehydrogenase (fumarate)